VIEKSYKFPPDGFEWLSKWLLFEFQVRLERDLEGDTEVKQKDVAENWEEDEGDKVGDSWVREEAKRRTVVFVKGKKGLA